MFSRFSHELSQPIMYLEPVYVIPAAEPTPLPTRRAWLVAGGAFVTGAVGAAVGGNLFGSNLSGSVLAGDAEAGQAGVGELSDAQARQLRWLHGLCADSSPCHQLESFAPGLTLWLTERPHDRVLWHGMERPAAAALDGSSLNPPSELAGILLLFLTGLEPVLAPTDPPVEIDFEGLRRVGRGR